MIVDLSHAYRSGMQVYPGTPEVFIETTNPGPWKCLGLHLSTHAGTHIDAPSHFDPPGGATIDQFPLERFVGPGVVYHVSPVDDDQPIRLENLSPEFPLQDQSNLFLILRTGWDQYWGSERYMRNPYLAPELAQAIADTGVSLIGIDLINADGISRPTGEAHRILFLQGIPIVENLTNLDQLEAGRVYQFCFAPLLIPGGDGAPTRALAWTQT